MSYTVIVEERAKRDIRDAAYWMAQHSPEKAMLWHFEIEEAIVSLENSPFRCPLAGESRYSPEEIRQLIFEKYRILFAVREEEVHVLHVRHGARDYAKPEEDE